MSDQKWQQKPLSELSDIGSSKRIAMSQYVDKGIPFYRSREIILKSKGLPVPETLYIESGLFEDLDKKFGSPSSGDILITAVGTIGQAYVVSEFDKFYFKDGNLLWLRNMQGILPNYLIQYFRSPYFSRNIDLIAAGSSQAALTIEKLEKMKVPLPSLGEQRKIAEILSTWDKSIGATEKLLENSKKRKKALMQQLLTGKKRLPGFSGGWNTKRLSSIAEIKVSPVDKKSIEGQRQIRLCNYMDVYRNGYINLKIDFMEATASDAEIEKFSIRLNDVLITKDSESPADIAVPALVDEELQGVVCGYHLAILRPNVGQLDGAYLAFLLTMPRVRHYFFTLANGATRFGLSIGSIQKAEFALPRYEEQRQIASVLRVCDKEIDCLEIKLDSLKSEKKALMQQLLTGKRRVKVEETV